jgi:pimeloyl-ACP methyl ester carboxylesterase
MEPAPTLTVNGIEMYYGAEGEGAPLLFVHGFLGSGPDWKYIFKTAPAGHRLIAPDLRAHGRSTGWDMPFTFRQCALDVLALLDHLKMDGVRAIGLSGGGQTLLHMATQQPNRIESMVLVSTAHYFPESARRIMRETSVESRSENEWQTMRQRHHHGDDQIRSLWKHANALKDSVDDVNFTPPYLSRIKARTLIVHGDRDPFYPVTIALELHGAIAGSHLWVVPHGGHGPVFGDQAQPFVDTAMPFLRGAWET